jgi:hypothetical protein
LNPLQCKCKDIEVSLSRGKRRAEEKLNQKVGVSRSGNMGLFKVRLLEAWRGRERPDDTDSNRTLSLDQSDNFKISSSHAAIAVTDKRRALRCRLLAGFPASPLGDSGTAWWGSLAVLALVDDCAESGPYPPLVTIQLRPS